jgi:hypothetical protein
MDVFYWSASSGSAFWHSLLEQFIRLRDYLRAFPDLELTSDYELAAEFFNTCRAWVQVPIRISAIAAVRKLFIEWTAKDAEVEIASELVELQVQLACWQYSWTRIWEDAEQRMMVMEQARIWSEKVLNISGLLAVN